MWRIRCLQAEAEVRALKARKVLCDPNPDDTMSWAALDFSAKQVHSQHEAMSSANPASRPSSTSQLSQTAAEKGSTSQLSQTAASSTSKHERPQSTTATESLRSPRSILDEELCLQQDWENLHHVRDELRRDKEALQKSRQEHMEGKKTELSLSLSLLSQKQDLEKARAEVFAQDKKAQRLEDERYSRCFEELVAMTHRAVSFSDQTQKAEEHQSILCEEITALQAEVTETEKACLTSQNEYHELRKLECCWALDRDSLHGEINNVLSEFQAWREGKIQEQLKSSLKDGESQVLADMYSWPVHIAVTEPGKGASTCSTARTWWSDDVGGPTWRPWQNWDVRDARYDTELSPSRASSSTDPIPPPQIHLTEHALGNVEARVVKEETQEAVDGLAKGLLKEHSDLARAVQKGHADLARAAIAERQKLTSEQDELKAHMRQMEIVSNSVVAELQMQLNNQDAEMQELKVRSNEISQVRVQLMREVVDMQTRYENHISEMKSEELASARIAQFQISELKNEELAAARIAQAQIDIAIQKDNERMHDEVIAAAADALHNELHVSEECKKLHVEINQSLSEKNQLELEINKSRSENKQLEQCNARLVSELESKRKEDSHADVGRTQEIDAELERTQELERQVLRYRLVDMKRQEEGYLKEVDCQNLRRQLGQTKSDLMNLTQQYDSVVSAHRVLSRAHELLQGRLLQGSAKHRSEYQRSISMPPSNVQQRQVSFQTFQKDTPERYTKDSSRWRWNSVVVPARDDNGCDQPCPQLPSPALYRKTLMGEESEFEVRTASPSEKGSPRTASPYEKGTPLADTPKLGFFLGATDEKLPLGKDRTLSEVTDMIQLTPSKDRTLSMLSEVTVMPLDDHSEQPASLSKASSKEALAIQQPEGNTPLVRKVSPDMMRPKTPDRKSTKSPRAGTPDVQKSKAKSKSPAPKAQSKRSAADTFRMRTSGKGPQLRLGSPTSRT